jgi:hypothetical protein
MRRRNKLSREAKWQRRANSGTKSNEKENGEKENDKDMVGFGRLLYSRSFAHMDRDRIKTERRGTPPADTHEASQLKLVHNSVFSVSRQMTRIEGQ